jgi:glycosyltransferase involved in cell wall biosynthesis
MAAASQHEVWVLTNAANVPLIGRSKPGADTFERIHLEGIPFGVRSSMFAPFRVVEHHWYYESWQREAAVRAQALDREVDFDVVHHVTLANYWTRVGVTAVQKPFVWGPVGGGVNVPFSLLTALGSRGVAEEAARLLARLTMDHRPLVQRTQHRAFVTFAQNQATATRIRGPHRLQVLPNALAVDLNTHWPAGRRTQDLLFVGRLIPWKSPLLVLRSLRYVEHPSAVLRFCGEGRERPRLERAAKKWGLWERVNFEGWMPRDRLLNLVATAGALIHPALHEEAGLCIAEALSLGTPVICFDHGGPAEVVKNWPGKPIRLIPPQRVDAAARAIAVATDEFLARPPLIPQTATQPSTSFSDSLLRAYERAGESRGPSRKARTR